MKAHGVKAQMKLQIIRDLNEQVYAKPNAKIDNECTTIH